MIASLPARAAYLCPWVAPCCQTVLAVHAVLSHASYKRPVVQKEILRLGGVPLMLSQCQVRIRCPMSVARLLYLLFSAAGA